MRPPLTQLSYRAEESLATSATVWIELPDGRPYARIRRRRTAAGRQRWDWTGGGLTDFAIEVVAPGTSFLITDANGAPFGHVRQRGFLRPRLVAADASRERFAIEVDGRIVAAQGHRDPLGQIDLPTPWLGRTELAATDDLTLRSLLMAAPLCHAAQTLLLQV